MCFKVILPSWVQPVHAIHALIDLLHQLGTAVFRESHNIRLLFVRTLIFLAVETILNGFKLIAE